MQCCRDKCKEISVEGLSGIICIPHFRSSGSKPFLVEAPELISSGSKPFLVETGEIFSKLTSGALGRSHDIFTDVTKLVESFGLVDSVL